MLQPVTVRGQVIDVGALVDSRIWVYRLPPPEEWSNETPGVVLRREGGDPLSAVPQRNVIFRLETFGGQRDPNKADELADVCAQWLDGAQMVKTDHGVFIGAQPQGGASDVVDPSTGWPFITQAWRVALRMKAE